MKYLPPVTQCSPCRQGNSNVATALPFSQTARSTFTTMAPVTAQEEFAKDKKLKRENIKYLREWLSKQPHLPTGITDEQLILFLHCCQHSLEACKQTIEAYYTIRTHAPELFGNRDPRRKEIQEAMSTVQMMILPNRDQHGNIVMLCHIADEDAAKFSYENVLNTWFMLQDITLWEHGAVPGFVFVADMKGTSLAHAARVHIATVKKYYAYIQDAFPGNVVATHLVNANPVTEVFLNLSKPFLKKELAAKIFVHTSCEPLHQHVTKDALPKEFGGNLDSLTSYTKISYELLEHYRDRLMEEETQRVEESSRPGKAKSTGDVFGVEGSFQKLEID